MAPQELVRAFSRAEFLREIHHLLWIEPLLNDGKLDQGWNCRDHAVITAGIASMLGFTTAVMHGAACFVQGPVADATPVGLKLDTHAWVGIERAGLFDLSVRVSRCSGLEGWRDWDVTGLIGSRFVPGGKADWQSAGDQIDYENRINAATHREGVNTAVYFGTTYDDLSTREIEKALSYCNSPLTDRLRATFGPRQELYAKAILHLVEFLRGEGETLTGLEQMDAWAQLLERRGDAIYRVCTRARLKRSR